MKKETTKRSLLLASICTIGSGYSVTTLDFSNVVAINEDNPIVVGNSWRYESVTSGVDAVVTVLGLTNTEGDMDDGYGRFVSGGIGGNDIQLSNVTGAPSTGFFGEYSLQFVNQGDGSAATINDITLQVYDIDSDLGSSFSDTFQFQTGTPTSVSFSPDSDLTTSIVDPGWTRVHLQGMNGDVNVEFTDFVNQPDYTVQLDFDSLSEFRFRWGATGTDTNSFNRTMFLAGEAQIAVIPEPSGSFLIALGGGLALLRRKRS